MKAREIILRPIITEKTTFMQERENTVCFEVDRRANKIQVRKAVEELFDVKVTGVHVVNLKGKPTMRYGRTVSHRPAVRKAYVQLAEGSKTLEFFEGI
ncbi:MAG: 50S ribosomal protein L23 [Acidobacteriota bacterium]|jgi:large subunit ribosomal protein L23|nr:50S ribosomal protein L23 [Acidobacteriota bacterium]